MSDDVAEGLMTFTAGAMRQLALDIEARLTPLCVCDKCGNWEVAATVKRAAQIVRDRADLYDGIRR